MKCVNIKLWDILGCFHYILNAPRIVDFKEITDLIYAECYVFGDFLKLHEASLATLKPVQNGNSQKTEICF